MARREQWDTLGSIRNVNTSANNRFDNYSNPFEYDDMSSVLDDIFKGYEDKINMQTADDIATQQGGAAARMASRGITGGSVIDDTLSGISADINKRKYNVLGELGIGKAGQKANLMDLFNKNKLQTTQLASNIDLSNIGNELQRLGLEGNYVTNMAQMDMQAEQQPGLLEDIFSGIGLASQLAGIPMTGGASLLSTLLG